MARFSLNFSVVPVMGKPLEFDLYAAYNIWQGSTCVSGPEIFQRRIRLASEASQREDITTMAIELSDIFYQELSEVRAESMRASIRETNARPSDTSVPSSL